MEKLQEPVPKLEINREGKDITPKKKKTAHLKRSLNVVTNYPMHGKHKKGATKRNRKKGGKNLKSGNKTT